MIHNHWSEKRVGRRKLKQDGKIVLMRQFIIGMSSFACFLNDL